MGTVPASFNKRRRSLYQRVFEPSTSSSGIANWTAETKGLNPLFQAAHRFHQGPHKGDGPSLSWRRGVR